MCGSIAEAREDLVRLRTEVASAANGHGYAIIAASTHPFARWQDQKTTDKERYTILERDMQAVLRRLVISGMHVHVGIEDEEVRIDLLESDQVLPAPPLRSEHVFAVLGRRNNRPQELPQERVQGASAYGSAA